MANHFRIPASMGVRLEALGVSPAVVLRRAGLPSDLFERPLTQLNTDAVFALWRALTEVSGRADIGVVLGSESRVEHFPAAILAALAAPDFGTAVDQLARYKRLTCPEDVVQTVRAREWKIQFRWLAAEGPEPNAIIDCSFAWVLTIGRRGTGQNLSPLRVELRRPRGRVGVLERHFRCPVHCGKKADVIVFRASDARLPFLTRNEELRAILSPHFDRELQRQAGVDSVVDLVRDVIRDGLSGRKPGIAEVARELHQSPRTLQRRLRAAGYSYHQLLDDARRQLARHHLSNPALELNEVAFLLGYENGNSFVRAFRAWEGSPPGRWRRAADKACRVPVAS